MQYLIDKRNNSKMSKLAKKNKIDLQHLKIRKKSAIKMASVDAGKKNVIIEKIVIMNNSIKLV